MSEMSKKSVGIVKNKIKGYLNLAIIFIPLLLTVSLFRNVQRVNKAKERIKEAEEELVELEKEKEELEVRLEFVQSDQFIEKQLRDNLGLAKEGEVVVVLPDEEILRKLAPKHVEEEETLPDPNWKKWYKLFF